MSISCPLCSRTESRGVAIQTQGDVDLVNCSRCGTFEITGSAVATIQSGGFSGDRWRLSAATRRSSDAGRLLRLRSDTLGAAATGVRAPIGPLEAIDLLVIHLAENQGSPERFVRVIPDDVSAVLAVPDGAAASYYLQTARTTLGYVEAETDPPGEQYRLTMDGWRRYREVNRSSAQTMQAFVAMWFHDDLDEAYEQGLAKGIRAAGYNPYRVKDEEHSGKIDDLIVREIRRSALIVADFTGQRQNVYYEAGLADGLGIPVVRSVRASEEGQLHFDTRQYGHIIWTDAADLAEKIRNRIEATAPIGVKI